MNRKLLLPSLTVILMLTLTACAPSGFEREEAGFFSGIWHGMILIFSFIGKLFGADIGIYAEHNTGFTYWFGFILGIGGFGGGAASSRR